MNLSEIRERVEGATGPDREVDGLIALHLEGWTFQKMKGDRGPYWRKPGETAYYMRAPGPPFYTASVDAALGLIERVLGGKIGPVCLCIAGGAQASIEQNDPCGWSVQVVAPTTPLALLRALLAALEAEPTPKGDL